jgi:hypothetical protein
MTKFVLFFAGAAALAAPALADTSLKFERDGITYVGSISEHDGVRHISGREEGSHRAFDLLVANGRVTGNYGGDYVNYAEPASAKLAAR